MRTRGAQWLAVVDPCEGFKPSQGFFEATRRFAEEVPGQFLLGAVGTTLNL